MKETKKQEDRDREKIYPMVLTNWIETQPELSYLTKAANDTPALYSRNANELIIAPIKEDVINKEYDRFSRKLREFIWPSAQSMRGDCFGTKNFDQTCARAGNTMSASTIWDAVSTVPFVQFALLNYLKGAAFPAAIIISLGLMVASNAAGRTGSNRAKGRATIANFGLAGFILLSIIKTAFSGVGFDILVNQDGITKEYAKDVLALQINKQQEKLTELRTLSNPKLINLQNACQPLQEKLASINKDINPKTFETVYVQAYGTYAQKQSMIGLTNDQIVKKFGGVSGIPGMCNKAEAQLSIDLKQADILQERISVISGKAANLPPLELLKTEFPAVYKDKFKTNSKQEIEIRSGQEIVGQATKQFIVKLQDPQRIAELGISLFWMSISIILSTIATVLLWSLSLTKEMRMSYNTTLLGYRMKLLQSYQDSLPTLLKTKNEKQTNASTTEENKS